MARVGIVGGGAFGTAMACVPRRRGHNIAPWARKPEVVAAIDRERSNATHLRGITQALRARLARGTPVVSCSKKASSAARPR